MIRPQGVDLHFEVELALVIGKQVKDLEASDEKGALESIESAYSFTARNTEAKMLRQAMRLEST